MKFSILTFGCRVNQADSLSIARDLAARGGEHSPPDAADVVLVNTCSVTSAAEQDARQAIRRLARQRPGRRIVVTGCYARRDPAALSALPSVHGVVEVHEASTACCGVVERDGRDLGDMPGSLSMHAPPAGVQPGFLGRTVAVVSVQNGCDSSCAYCVVPLVRGRSRSTPAREVVARLRFLEEAGFSEVILAGVHLGSWGRDLEPRQSLTDLLAAVCGGSGRLRIRLSSIEPMDVTPEVEDLLAASTVFAPHLHLPVQHASDRVLGLMRRPYAFDTARRLFERLRSRLPHAALGTDLLVGFPGEEESDFRELVNWLRDSPLSYAHAFPFSPRPGTPAASMEPRVPGASVRDRLAAIRAESARLQRRFSESQVGRVLEALTTGDGTVALTGNYLKVRIPGGQKRNERVLVRVASAHPLLGELASHP